MTAGEMYVDVDAVACVETPGLVLYFWSPVGDFDCMLFSVWVYLESNGMDGLQRADEVKDDTCGGMIESDVIFF